MQIPTNLNDFEFILAWEELKIHRAKMHQGLAGEASLLEYFSAIGPQKAVSHIRDQIVWENEMLQKYGDQVKKLYS